MPLIAIIYVFLYIVRCRIAEPCVYRFVLRAVVLVCGQKSIVVCL